MSGVEYIDAGLVVASMTQVLHTTEITLRSLKNSEEAEISRQVETLLETVREMNVGEAKWQELVVNARTVIQRQLQSPRDVALNWGLVSLWARFEALLEDTLLLLFAANEKAFLSWVGDTSLKFHEIKDCSSIDVVKHAYFLKIIKSFMDLGINKRVEALNKNLNTRTELLFSQKYATDSIKAALTPKWGPDSLKDLSDKRNRIVHNQALPLEGLNDLQNAEIVLERFLVNLCMIIGRKLEMPVMAYGVLLPELP